MLVHSSCWSSRPPQDTPRRAASGPGMLVANSLGAVLFMRILLDRELPTNASPAFFHHAGYCGVRRGLLRLASTTPAIWSSPSMRKQTGVSCSGHHDTQNLLAFIGIGSAHHLPGTLHSFRSDLKAIESNES